MSLLTSKCYYYINGDELRKAASELTNKEQEFTDIKGTLILNEKLLKTVESELSKLTVKRDAEKSAKDAALHEEEKLTEELDKLTKDLKKEKETSE